MIRFTCPQCTQEIDVRDEVRGQQVRCLSCNALVDVPTNALPVGQPSPPHPLRPWVYVAIGAICASAFWVLPRLLAGIDLRGWYSQLSAEEVRNDAERGVATDSPTNTGAVGGAYAEPAETVIPSAPSSASPTPADPAP